MPDIGVDTRERVILPDDPNLALITIRIEVERRLRNLANRKGFPASAPAARIIRDLQHAGAISAEQASGLNYVLTAANSAAHGATVEASVAEWAQTRGIDILDVLDALASQGEP